MDARMLADERILDILKRDPQKGIVLLMEKYTALIWHVSSLYIKNPEDIKECVNDSFSEFYFHRKRFDPEKSSLSSYLTVIARNRAVSLYRKEQREKRRRADTLVGELAGDESQITKAELRADMERAMSLLKPNELQIIRMRYYDGMSVREIADSLELPYETVKKRHQRSVLKLGQSLMLVLVLIFILTACAYGVLRYLDVIPPIGSWQWPWQWMEMEEPEEEPDEGIGSDEVRELHLGDTTRDDSGQEPAVSLAEEEAYAEFPEDMQAAVLPSEVREEVAGRTPTVMEEYTIAPGYGINVSPAEPVYTLAKKESMENEEYCVTLEEVNYINHMLTVAVKIELKNNTINNWSRFMSGLNVESIIFGDDVWRAPSVLSRELDQHTHLLVFYFKNVLIQDVGENIKMSVQFNGGDSIAFDMVAVKQEKVTAYPNQIGEFGGILAMPRLEDGSLIIAIHPLDDEDELKIVPAINRDAGGSYPEENLTVTGEDGAVLTGECLRYRPWGEETYFEWDFGEAKPGSYTLNIPRVYMKADMPELSMVMNPLECTWENRRYPFPGGSIWIEDCEPIYEKPEELEELLWAVSSSETGNWRLRFGYDSVYPNCPVAGFYGLSCEMECYPPDAEEGSTDVDYFYRKYHMTMISNDIENGMMEYVLGVNCELANPESTNIQFSSNGAISLLWNQSFEIPFTVE